MSKDRTDRYLTKTYMISIPHWFYKNLKEESPPRYVNVQVKKVDNRYEVNHSYAFELNRYGARKGQVVCLRGTDCRFGARGLGRYDEWPALAVAREYARKVLNGIPVEGECSCHVCRGNGWIDTADGQRYGDPCPACKMTGIRQGARAA